MLNPFIIQKEFIELDNRSNRPNILNTNKGKIYTFNINENFVYKKHAISLPTELIKDKSILDIGSCLGATGAWVLSNGAKEYCGLEIQKQYAELSNQILSKYYNKSQFEIVNESFEDFISNKNFDIVVCFSALHGILDTFSALKKISELAKEIIIIESAHPFKGYKEFFAINNDEELKHIAKNICMIENKRSFPMIDARHNSTLLVAGSLPSLGSIKFILENFNWEYNDDLYELAENSMSEYYNLKTTAKFISKFHFNPNSNSLKILKNEIVNPNSTSVLWTNN
jgi:hypothetical protein